jgi:hypothetical protein
MLSGKQNHSVFVKRLKFIYQTITTTVKELGFLILKRSRKIQTTTQIKSKTNTVKPQNI